MKSKIERAKNLASTLKATSDSDDQSFTTSTSGVRAVTTQDLVFPEFKPEINYNDEFWRTYLKN